MMPETLHVPVMPIEVLALLNPVEGAVVLDCTLGLGGHAALIAERIGASGRMIGIDQDNDAIKLARERLSGFSGRLDIVKNSFARLGSALDGVGVTVVDAVLFDLGVSSLQLDDAGRGFSFRMDGPLDMRMDRDAGTTAEDLVNDLSEEALADIIFNFGEERFSRRIARVLVAARAGERIRTTAGLAEIVLKALRRGYQRNRLHPATRTFQALRIAVNGELDILAGALTQAFERLKPGGRMAVIAFHSLEDRIVKAKFRSWAREGRAVLLTKKPLRPGDAEAADNPRARSARLRVIERIGDDGAFS